MSVSACLIVRDEAARLAGCLASVAPFVDEVVVADTGSTDDTVAVAEAIGARVVHVEWRDDFAAARNAALAACTGDWVLSVDADERAVGEPEWLPLMLETLGDDVVALSVQIEEAGGQNPRGHLAHRSSKLFRRERCRWRSRVHEQIVLASGPDEGSRPAPMELPREALLLAHDGYADPVVVRAKTARNLRLAGLELADLVAERAPEPAVVRVLLDLGRSQLALGEREHGVATLADVRERSRAGTQGWLWATDFLAWDAVRHGDADIADGYARELGAVGAPPDYLRTLAAQIAYLRGDRERGDALAAAVTRRVTVTGHPA